MKIYISADIEGVGGIVHGSSASQPNPDYMRYRKLMTQEVNAAIEGAFEAGAKEVVVNDGHGSMRNIIIEDLHPDARLISGYPKPHLQISGLDESFDGALFIGFHARNNTKGVLSHTFFGLAIYEVNLNGRPVSEAEFDAAIAGYFNVPVLMISGDDVLQEQVTATLPTTLYAQTKIAMGARVANSISPQRAGDLIKETAKKAIVKCKEIQPYRLNPPYTLEIVFKSTVFAEIAENIPGMIKISDNTVQYKNEELLNISKMLTTVFNASCVLLTDSYK